MIFQILDYCKHILSFNSSLKLRVRGRKTVGYRNNIIQKTLYQWCVPAQGKKERIMERRIIKNFQIGIVEGVVNEIISNEKETKNIFGKIAKAIGRAENKKKDWNALVRNSGVVHDPIGSTSEAARKARMQSVRRYILEHQGASLMEMDPDKLIEYNPQLAEINPTARIAYAKFKMNLIQQEYKGLRGVSVDDNVSRTTMLSFDEDASRNTSTVRPRPRSMKILNSVPDLPRRSSTIRRKAEDTSILFPQASIKEEHVAVNFNIRQSAKDALVNISQQSINKESSASQLDEIQTVSASVDQTPVAPPPLPPLTYTQVDETSQEEVISSKKKSERMKVYSQPEFIRPKPRPGNWL